MAKSLKTVNRGKIIFCTCLVVLPLLQFLIFYVGVNFNSIKLAFEDYDLNGKSHFVGFHNFAGVFKEFVTVKNWGTMLGNSFLIWILSEVTKVPLTLFVSYFVYKKAKVGGFFKVIFFAPSIMSIMVTVVIYENFVDTALPEILNKVFHADIRGGFFQDIGDSSLSSPSFWAVFMFGFWCGFGTSMLLYSNAMSNISESIVEAAHLDGIGFMQEFFHITFPMIFPTFKMLFVVGVASILGNQFNLYEFYGMDAKTPLHTVGYYLYQQTMTTNLTEGYPRLAAMGVVITCVAVPIALFARWLMNRIDPMEERAQ